MHNEQGHIDKSYTIHKPWGKEVILALTDFYCYKRIYINKGHKCSLHYHNNKVETNYIISGEAKVIIGNKEYTVGPGEYFTIRPTDSHRVEAITDVILQEVSTPEIDDVIRIQDDTNRGDGKIESEHM